VSLSCTTVEWRGLTLASDRSSPFGVRGLQGWDELPDVRVDAPARPQGHGRFDTPVWSDERVVTLAGQIVSQDRDALLQQLAAVMTWSRGPGRAEDLVVTRAGRRLTAGARLTAFKTPTDLDWSVGVVPFAIEWRCRDPLRYGDPQSVATGFPVLRGGLEYDLYTDGTTDTGFLEFGEASDTGRVVLENPGTADVSPVFQVDGPIDASGFDIAVVGTDQRIRFSGPVSAGSVLVIDSGSGTAVVDGSADRGGLLAHRDWFSVRAGESLEIAFIPLGVDLGGQLTAVVRPGFW
jgi:hypothetical protein